MYNDGPMERLSEEIVARAEICQFHHTILNGDVTILDTVVLSLNLTMKTISE